MAKKKPKQECEEIPGWLITFSDMMTLMLTFFVLLVSMSRVDERRKLVVLGSIIGTFGWNEQSHEALTVQDTKRTVDPGPIQSKGDLSYLKPLLWEDNLKDISFQSSRFVQVVTINADVLFAPGASRLSPQGEELLNRMLPALRSVQYPLLIAGHASMLRDEMGESYKPGKVGIPDPSWKISMGRTLAVYRFLLDGGVPKDMLRMEAFGRFHPHYTEDTAEGRRMNRRVDLVLDKRSLRASEDIDSLQPKKVDEDNGTVDIDGFKFKVP